jgi:hypothetical protein
MNRYADIQLMIVRQRQRDRLAEAAATRLTRRAPRPPAGDPRRYPTREWRRRVLAVLRLPAWG